MAGRNKCGTMQASLTKLRKLETMMNTYRKGNRGGEMQPPQREPGRRR